MWLIYGSTVVFFTESIPTISIELDLNPAVADLEGVHGVQSNPPLETIISI